LPADPPTPEFIAEEPAPVDLPSTNEIVPDAQLPAEPLPETAAQEIVNTEPAPELMEEIEVVTNVTPVENDTSTEEVLAEFVESNDETVAQSFDFPAGEANTDMIITAEAIEPEVAPESEKMQLPEPVVAFVEALANIDDTTVGLEEKVEMLLKTFEVEVEEEEALETVHAFTDVVTDIKKAVESSVEVTEEQVQELVVATIELLQVLGLESQTEHISQVIVLILGEEFVAQYAELINDRVVDALGTHERKTWFGKTVPDPQEADNPSTVIGRLALQLGLTLQSA
jgi:hypothetical protein